MKLLNILKVLGLTAFVAVLAVGCEMRQETPRGTDNRGNDTRREEVRRETTTTTTPANPSVNPNTTNGSNR